jgi:hypothetical protein
MASAAQIAANRRNAQKSTGPRTQTGKARSRLNALTHGFRAYVITPLLPHENPRVLEERLQTWMQEMQPRPGAEAELICRAARLSWMVERAERVETVHLSHRVRKAQQRWAGAPTPKRLDQVADLGRKLFYLVNPRMQSKPGALWGIPGPQYLII